MNGICLTELFEIHSNTWNYFVDVCLQIIYIYIYIYQLHMCKDDLALNYLQILICYKSKHNQDYP